MPFQPGESGNPAGRPRGARNKKTLLLEALLRKVLGMGRRSGDPGMRRLIERTLAPRPRKPIPARPAPQSSPRSSSGRVRGKRRVVLHRSKKRRAIVNNNGKYNGGRPVRRRGMGPPAQRRPLR